MRGATPMAVPDAGRDCQADRRGTRFVSEPAHVGWQSVWCLSPVVPAAVLREVFRATGVHVYCDSGDNLSANASWVCLHAATGGHKTIRLPAPALVYGTIGEKLALERGTQFSVDLEAGETGIRVFARPDR